VITVVAVGILQQSDGQLLLAQRPAGKPYEGWWEFPGGKCEPSETPGQALDRELAEELHIQVTAKRAWLVQDFVYPHATVELHFFLVTDWQGTPVSAEGQQLAWNRPNNIQVQPLLPASIAVVQWLAWPRFVALSDLAFSPINAQSCCLLETVPDETTLDSLCSTTRRPIYIRTRNAGDGTEGYLSRLLWQQP
jgi:8-oxo-dGTP diphosphatase